MLMIGSDIWRAGVMLAGLAAVVGGLWLFWDGLRSAAHFAGPAAVAPAVAHPVTTPPLTASAGTIAILELEEDGTRIEVKASPAVIGRHSSDDIRLDDVRVSRRHARLERHANGQFEIHNQTADRSEPNPVLVNGVYREHAEIKSGDVISLGGVAFRFRVVPRAVA